MNKKTRMLIICSILFMGSLTVADISSVKLIQTSIFGLDVLVPLGTIAFALTFLATDVVSEVFGRATALNVLGFGVLMRLITWGYFFFSIGNLDGNVFGFSTPEFWTTDNQASYSFVLGSSMSIFIAGFVAIIISSLNDIYVFHYFKRKDEGKNRFWMRNNISTIFSQVINSLLFISIAYATIMPVKGILMAVAGQVIVKFMFAIFDTPLAYLMRNYAQEKEYWFKFWTADFWKG